MGIRKDRELMDALCEIEEGLDEYELEFVESVASQVHDQNKPLTSNQTQFATKLYDRFCSE